MNVWVLEFELAILFFVALVPILVIPFLATIFRDYGRMPLWPTLLAALTGLYACALIAFTFFPLPEVGPGFCDGRALVEYWQTVPFDSIGPALQKVAADPFVAIRSSVVLQVVFNVVFFVPLGLILAYRLRKPLWFAAVCGFGLSFAIEALQGTAILGHYPCPYRNADVDDLLLNTSGAIVGWLLGAGISRWAPYRDPEPIIDRDPPGVARRGLSVVADVLAFVGLTVVVQIIVGLIVIGPLGTDRDVGHTLLAVVPFAVALTLFIVVPLARSDRATPGQRAVLVRPIGQDGQSPSIPLALLRNLIRYTWLVFLHWVFLVVLVADVISVLVRSDRRSLVDLASGTQVRVSRTAVGTVESGREQQE